MLRETLIESGVAEADVLIVPKEEESVATALDMARQGDLVLIFCDGITRSWKQIIYFKPAFALAPVVPEARVAAAGFDVPAGYRLMSDERGVRIVPEA